MPRIDNVRRINSADFPTDSQQTMAQLAEIYNYFAEQVTNTLNGGVDFSNLSRSLVEIQLSTNALGNPIQTTRFTAGIGIQGINVVRADNLTNIIGYPNSAPFVSFTTSGTGTYTIQNVTGLRPTENYRLVLELIFA